MEYSIGKSTKQNAQECVNEATNNLKNPKLILFFAPVPQFDDYTTLIHEKFPDSICMGATTIASFSKEGADKNALKVVGIESGITCAADMIEDVDKFPVKYIDRVHQCVEKVRDKKNTICLEFTTALLCAEESVLTALSTVLAADNIPIFGGTAGDVGTAVGTKVSLNGKVVERSCVFALIHNEGGAIKIFRENIYTPKTGKVLTATKVDSLTRTVLTYNNQPAAKVFAEELGVSESEIPKYIDTNPIGRLVGDEMYITANCNVTSNHGMAYHARIYNNSKVVVLKPDDYRTVVKETFDRINREMPRASFAIMCHCLARTLLFEKDGYLQEYAKLAGNRIGNYIGFSGYGEQYNMQHFNQTMTIAMFE